MQDNTYCCSYMKVFTQDKRMPFYYDTISDNYYLTNIEGKELRLFHHCPWCKNDLSTNLTHKNNDEMELTEIKTRNNIQHCCTDMEHCVNDPNTPLQYSALLREYYLK